MTDRELMQQALEVLERCPAIYRALEAAKALRERLAQPEQEPVDNAEKAGAYLDARLWEFIDMAAAWPEAKPDPRTWEHVLVYAPKQPQMQPCAGRNCGSINPNLHSAECFEDYEKATGADSNRTWTQAHWTEYEHSIAAAEREAIAQSLDKQADMACDEIDRQWAQEMAAAVRARGQT